MAIRTSKGLLFVGAAALATINAAPGWAQTAAGGGRSAAASATLGEVIVTAQRRSENVQSVPISVNALTAADLKAKGGTSSEDLAALVPAVVYNPGVGGGQMTIRGIGGTNSGVDPGNAVYIDGVYQFAPQSNLFEFNAVERIEILKGPQGTLFGRNSTGGLVQVITRDPSVEKTSGEMQVGYASRDRISGNLYFNQPITDTLAVNVAAYGFDQREGWGRNFVTGNPAHDGYAWGVRTKIRWEAQDGKTDVTVAASFNKDKPTASGTGALPPGTFDITGSPGVGLYNANSDIDSYRTDVQYTYSATIHHDLGFARFTSITAYDNVYGYAKIDADLTPAPILIAQLSGTLHTVSQEFHLQSEETSKLEWIVGAYYLYDNSPGKFSLTVASAALPPSSTKTTTRSYAAFAQASYPITDDTKITAGLRYTKDQNHLVATAVDQRAEAGKPTWHFALDHKFTPDVLGYVSYSRGFKSGLFNPTSPTHSAAAPETLDAYEVGLKTESFGHRLRVNGAAFYYDFKDVQIQLFDPNTSFAYIANAGTARSMGVDLDAALEPMAGLTLTAGVSLIDTKFTEYDASKPLPPCFRVDAITGLTIRDSCSYVGNRLPFAPTFTGSLGASYKIETDRGEFIFSGNYNYNSGYFVDSSNFVNTRAKVTNMLNLAINWTSESGHLNASFWGKNLLNQRVIGSADVGAGLLNTTIAYPLAPLMVGGTFGVKF